MLSFVRKFHSSIPALNTSKVRLTLFSKQQCGLCDTAKSVMDQVVQNPNYKKCKYIVVDIMDPDHKQWFDKYCFDVPVLHVQSSQPSSEQEIHKLFHRFNEKEVEDLIEEVK